MMSEVSISGVQYVMLCYTMTYYTICDVSVLHYDKITYSVLGHNIT